jgi:hypothetical protein
MRPKKGNTLGHINLGFVCTLADREKLNRADSLLFG